MTIGNVLLIHIIQCIIVLSFLLLEYYINMNYLEMSITYSHLSMRIWGKHKILPYDIFTVICTIINFTAIEDDAEQV